jgi:hypothetical protein
VGSISAGGLYTAPASITAAQTVTVTATSVADSTKTASAAVSLAPPVSVSLTPATVTLGQAQTQAFTASVANSSNTAVTWTLSPALGSISTAGLYTAPSSIATAQTVTVTATSVANPAIFANAVISLAAPLAGVMSTQAKSADSFVDSIGLNVHFSYYGSIYTSQSKQLVNEIAQLGVRHLRDQMAWQGSTPGAAFYAIHNQLGSLGVKTDYILTSIDYPMTQVAAYSELVNDMEAVEASNEYDASGDPSWVANIMAQQAALYTQIHGTSGTTGVTVISPSLAQPQNASKLGNVVAISDAGDSHAYFGGWNPGNSGTGGANNPAYFMHLAQINNPGQPIWITETGFWSVPGPYFGGYGVDEATMAVYLPRAFLEFWNAGAGRTYQYELADYSSSDSFGLLRSDGSAKPAFGAVANLLTLLSDPGTQFAPGKLAYSLVGAGSNVHQALFEKRDGSFYLALWIETLSDSFTTSQPITVPPQAVALQIGNPVASITTYQWNAQGSVTTASISPNQALPLSLTDKLLIVKITP